MFGVEEKRKRGKKLGENRPVSQDSTFPRTLERGAGDPLNIQTHYGIGEGTHPRVLRGDGTASEGQIELTTPEAPKRQHNLDMTAATSRVPINKKPCVSLPTKEKNC